MARAFMMRALYDARPLRFRHPANRTRSDQRESRDTPNWNAFCRVAPSVLFIAFAILGAGVFCRAWVLSSRTSDLVQARRLIFFAISTFLQ
jgi:hypothetical protein